MKPVRSAASALLASVLIAGSAVLPASAGDRGTIDYVALGDSYAAGIGAGAYTVPLPSCAQSLLGYPALLDERKPVNLTINATCSGATVPDVAAQLGNLNPGTDLVTLTVGGNDVRYQLVIAACGQGTAPCEQAVAQAVGAARAAIGPQLEALYGGISTFAPDATVVVTGYPHLFSPEFGSTITFPGVQPVTGAPITLTLTPIEQQILNAGTTELNAVIHARAKAAGVTYVDVVERFDKHGLGSPQPWIQPFTDPAALHPNAKGYKNGYFHEIRNALN